MDTMKHRDTLALETERILVKPLTYEELLQYTQADNLLEKTLGLTAQRRIITKRFRNTLEQVIIPRVSQAGDNACYSTIWSIIDKNARLMVGDLCFKGPPNAQGEIEIGYGTYPRFQNKGYMTEAIGVLCAWALQLPEVKAVIAETDVTNVPSQRNLSKNNFSVYINGDKTIWWRLEKQAAGS